MALPTNPRSPLPVSHPSPSERAGALTPKELLEVLHQLFPEQCPNPADTDREIWMKAGERRAVTKMQAWFDTVPSKALL